MVSHGNEFAQVTQFICKLRGGSEPALVRADDGLLYVVKFINNLQGPNVLFNESAGTELYQACGLPTPPWKQLLISDEFLDLNPGSWMETDEGYRRPNSGLCIGSLYLSAESGRKFQTLPVSDYRRISNRMSFWLAWLIDVSGNHVDNRQAIFVEDGRGRLDAFFIDHGHLFGGPDGRHRLPLFASRYLNPRIYPRMDRSTAFNLLKVVDCLDVDRLWNRVQALPDDWKSPSALDGFTRCLQCLSDSARLQCILDGMIEDVYQSNAREHGQPRLGFNFHPALIYHDWISTYRR